MEWTDLRFFLAVHRARTLSGAARKLGVDQTTVGRRLEALEAAIGARLFRRTPDGYFLTSDGERALGHAESVEESVMSLERELSGHDQKPEGQVRLTTFDSIGVSFVGPRLGAFAERFPGIDLQLSTDNRVFDLSRQEADLALRAGRPSQSALTIRKIGTAVAGLYASPAYLKRHGEPRSVADLSRHQVFAEEDAKGKYPIQSWLLSLAKSARIVFRSNNVFAHAAAAAAGVGITVLYCYLGDTTRGLRRILPACELEQDLWIAVHRDLQYAARVRAVIEFLAEIAAESSDLLRGRRGRRARRPSG